MMKLVNIVLALLLCSCTLYQSEQRKAIEKNTDGIVVFTGLTPEMKNYFVCTQANELPDFLKEPLEVVDTPYEADNYSTLFSAQSVPQWLGVYHHDNVKNVHDYCKIYFLKSTSHLHSRALVEAAKIGVEQIEKMSRL
jgi:hypothetical protein